MLNLEKEPQVSSGGLGGEFKLMWFLFSGLASDLGMNMAGAPRKKNTKSKCFFFQASMQVCDLEGGQEK